MGIRLEVSNRFASKYMYIITAVYNNDIIMQNISNGNAIVIILVPSTEMVWGFNMYSAKNAEFSWSINSLSVHYDNIIRRTTVSIYTPTHVLMCIVFFFYIYNAMYSQKRSRWVGCIKRFREGDLKKIIINTVGF